MKVQNFENERGNKVANQFIITKKDGADSYEIFQSYDSIIVEKSINCFGETCIKLDINFYKYSNTTIKYRNLFLGKTTKDIECSIKQGIYILTNLNN